MRSSQRDDLTVDLTMSENDSKKVLKFPNNSIREQAPPDENKLLAIVKAAQEKIGELKSAQPDEGVPVPAFTVINTFNIHGGNNQLAPGNLTVGENGSSGSDAPQPANGSSETAPDTIDSAQKLQLRKLRDEIVKLSNECGFPKHPATIMSALNSNMGVRKYDQIVANEFLNARTYLSNLRNVFSERIDFHKKREELRRYMIQVVTDAQRKNQPQSPSGILGALDSLTFSDLEKMYDVVITDLI